jgi:hypothetical protein
MSTAESTIADLHRNPLLDRQDVLKIVTEMQDLNIELEDDAQRRFLIYDGVRCLRTSTLRLGQDVNSEPLREKHSWVNSRDLPTTPKSYPLVHNDNGSGSWVFYPTPANDFTKYQLAGYCHNSGTRYITINDHARFDATDLSISFMFNFPTHTGTHYVIDKDGEFRIEVNGSNIVARMTVGGLSKSTDFTYTVNTNTKFTMTYDNTAREMKIYENNVQVGSTVTWTSGSRDLTANNLSIFAKADGTNIVESGFVIAWLMMANGVVSSTWRGDYNNGIIDTSSANTFEITTIPFMATIDPKPDATLGGF